MFSFDILRALALGSAAAFRGAAGWHRGVPQTAPAKWRRTVTVSANRPSPTSPEGRARIEAAELKRARRALTADRNAYRSWCSNPCLSGSDRHNPTFVNRSE